MRSEVKRALCSPWFFLSMGVFFVCLQGFALPNYIFEVLNEPIEYRQSALALTLGGIFFGGVLLLLPFCAPMAHAISQVDDLRSGIMQWSVLRGGVARYAASKIIASFLAAAVSAFIAYAFHALLWGVLASPYDIATFPNHEIGFSGLFAEWANISHGLPIVLDIGFGLAFTAGVWSTVALATAMWVPDKLLVVTIPACIYKLWGSGLIYYLFNIHFTGPATLFNDSQTVPRIMEALLAYGVLLFVSSAVYYIGLKRRACHA